MAKKHTPESLARRVIRSSADWSCAGLPLIDFLAGRFPYRSREEWCERIHAGELKINGHAAEAEQLLQLHDSIEYTPGELPEPPAELRYDIVYEDEEFLVLNKPGNLCMHPSGPFFRHTLWHLLCSRYGEIHFLNRLDRETSGLLLAAKTATAAALADKNRAPGAKEYQVLVHGVFPEPRHAEGFLISDTASSVRKKRRFVEELPEGALKAEHAVTDLFPEESAGAFTMLRAVLGTGRMHQIRATLYSLGFPVAGDKLYGVDEGCYIRQRSDELTAEDRRRLILPRQALHACRLSFPHPRTGEMLEFHVPAPFSLADVLQRI